MTMDFDPRHARPAPKGPDPLHWWALRIIGLLVIGGALGLYYGGLFGALPVIARQFLTWSSVIVGLIIFVLGWLIPWISEG